MEQQVCIVVSGVVQSIGFRPAVYRLASEYGIKGKTANTPDGVSIYAQGSSHSITKLIKGIYELDLPGIRIDSLVTESIQLNKVFKDFKIDATINGDSNSEIPVDSIICEDCLQDLFNSEERKLYPFTACTKCGPRSTVIRNLPYDRRNTTMDVFSRCQKCESSYENPLSRRFNFETDSCWNCSPWIGFIDFNTKEYWCINSKETSSILEEKLIHKGYSCISRKNANGDTMLQLSNMVNSRISGGEIVAVKGLGGYQLFADAFNENTIVELRNRKKRPYKPLAIMLPTLEEVSKYCYINNNSSSQLTSRIAPIVLCKKKENGNIAKNVSFESDKFGVMLPYSPMHYILAKNPMVVTSANLSKQPIIYEEFKNFDHLSQLSDCALVHDREITMGVDDSLILPIEKESQIIIRRARGYIPESLQVPKHNDNILACGADLKNTFAISKRNKLFLSQHNGDMENEAISNRFLENIQHFKKMFGVEVKTIITDLHPGYATTNIGETLADKWDCKVQHVQHHFAHALSVMAEHKLKGKSIGLILDGTGYGTDETIWGCEVLILTPQSFKRVHHLENIDLLGGDLSVKEPYRQIAAIEELLNNACRKEFGYDFFSTALGFNVMSNTPYGKKRDLLLKVHQQKLNTVMSSSAGRLFDLASAVLLGYGISKYEGDAAAALEAAASRHLRKIGESIQDIGEYIKLNFQKNKQDIRMREVLEYLEVGMNEEITGNIPGLKALIKAVTSAESAKDPNYGAWVFHLMLSGILAKSVKMTSEKSNIGKCLLSGGCFQNNLLLTLISSLLLNQGIEVYKNERVPTNDAGLAVGQAYYAIMQRQVE